MIIKLLGTFIAIFGVILTVFNLGKSKNATEERAKDFEILLNNNKLKQKIKNEAANTSITDKSDFLFNKRTKTRK